MSRVPAVLKDHGDDLDRIKAFSDGVFSIAITLLVLSLPFPKLMPGQKSGLAAHMAQLALPMASYVISFVLVGLAWITHCRLLRHLNHHNRSFAGYNLVMLFFVTLIPFSSQLPNQYIRDPLAWAIYMGNLAGVSYATAFLWWKAMRLQYLKDDIHPVLPKYILTRALIPAVVFSLAGLLIMLDINLAKFAPLLAFPLMVFAQRHFTRKVHEHDELVGTTTNLP